MNGQRDDVSLWETGIYMGNYWPGALCNLGTGRLTRYIKQLALNLQQSLRPVLHVQRHKSLCVKRCPAHEECHNDSHCQTEEASRIIIWSEQSIISDKLIRNCQVHNKASGLSWFIAFLQTRSHISLSYKTFWVSHVMYYDRHQPLSAGAPIKRKTFINLTNYYYVIAWQKGVLYVSVKRQMHTFDCFLLTGRIFIVVYIR